MGWRSNCYTFFKENNLVGISIPHIEMGTNDEGRMFYFGIVPEMRGKGLGSKNSQDYVRVNEEISS